MNYKHMSQNLLAIFNKSSENNKTDESGDSKPKHYTGNAEQLEEKID